MNRRQKEKKGSRQKKLIIAAVLLLFTALLFLFGKPLLSRIPVNDHAPDYVTRMYLKKNSFSRPAERLPEVKNIVIHYVANPGTSAKANRNYFDNLSNPVANPAGTKASAHFIVGLEGEVIQCIPMTEIAYANYPRNYDTVSIETCHPDETGRFSDATYASLTQLAADLCRLYGLTAEDVIRHYDVSGKACPKYYVENESAWEALKADIAVKLAAQ